KLLDCPHFIGGSRKILALCGCRTSSPTQFLVVVRGAPPAGAWGSLGCVSPSAGRTLAGAGRALVVAGGGVAVITGRAVRSHAVGWAEHVGARTGLGHI